jgi:D-aminoacyl-tRNA deacylase
LGGAVAAAPKARGRDNAVKPLSALFLAWSARYDHVMRAVLQRVKSASVTVAGETVGAIGPGLLILLGVEAEDTAADVEWLAQKVVSLRLFADDTGAWNRNLLESGGGALVVSQFTLFASTKKGTKPSWHRAAKPDVAEPMCQQFVSALSELLPHPAQTGRFGAMMDVALINDGPVTLLLDTKQRE